MVPESELPEQLSGVGATALGVARLRVMENARSNRLVADPYAGHILAAAAAAGSQWVAVTPQAGPDFFALMADQVAVRTRFLDQTLLRLTRAGCAQVVLLACGMDTRAFRLDWPADTQVFEVDFKEVLTFRDAALASHGVGPRCNRIAVAADRRQDWTIALRSAGFDPTRATAWLAEGILYALPPDATDTLLDGAAGEGQRPRLPGSGLQGDSRDPRGQHVGGVEREVVRVVVPGGPSSAGLLGQRVVVVEPDPLDVHQGCGDATESW